jgi:Glycosyltransferase
VKKLKKSNKITVLSLSWRDITSPNAGGAEVHTHEMLSRVDKSKFRIYHLSTRMEGQCESEVIDGVTYLRHGNVSTVIFAAIRFYSLNRQNIDFVIDQCNTHRFFTPLWVEPEKRIFYIHQLTKEIWNYSARFPLNKVGKLLEESFLQLNRNDPVITVSESTKEELVKRGYQAGKIKIIHNGVSFKPWKQEYWCAKERMPTFIYAGRYSPYKGIDIAVEALARVKKDYPYARLWIIGKKDQKYVERNLMSICERNHLVWEDATDSNPTGDVVSWGFVSEDKKLELLSRSWALLFPSVREGWGIPITEAGCVGTPSIAFDSPGIREAVNYGKAGYLCFEKTINGLAAQMQLVVFDKVIYDRKRESAYWYSSQFQWDGIGKELEEFINNCYNRR